ncbi:Lrp/AsnC family transcriptional regulator [Streptomyces tsukubensis]|uniref:AsnC family protein n=1 Tax=Streptomyces tsukubensis TaxID=83656 RepID=A0A1V4ACU4_9ACTN|nr:AsnC family transcriptional regulator [Streptomyces tsukubensis]OON81772.1 AsnC family protein [Streptomyces tsukubensis]QFR96557.1 AsnC family transcriptional regulator [Streptomyces tsukubensis]
MEFDTLDLRLMHALEVDARAPFSRFAEVLGVSDQTVARRYRRLRTGAGVKVVGVVDRPRLGEDSWILRLRCTPDAAGPIARSLARRSDTSWIGLTSGGTEVVCTTRSSTTEARDELLLGKLPRTPSIVEIQAHQYLHRFYGGPSGWLGKSGALTEDEVARLRPEPGAYEAPVRPLPEDEPLLAALRADGRASVAELQQRTGASESAVRRRLDQLVGSGTVYLDVQYDGPSFGFGVSALLWITAAPSALDSVGRALAGHREIAHAAAVAGPCNLTAVLVCADSHEVYRYLSETLGRLEGVQHVECAPTLRQVKQLTYEEPRIP